MNEPSEFVPMKFYCMYIKVSTGQGKVREICFFFKVREKSENSVKWSGKSENLQKSGNFKIMLA